jgi:Domain of unknown function (DUF4115)
MRRRRMLEEELSWIGLGAVLIVIAALVVSGVGLSDLVGGDSGAVEETPTTAAEVKGSASPRTTRAEPRRRAPPTPANEVVVTAVRGDCWVSLRRGSAAGEVLFEGLLVRGRRARVRGAQVFVRLGAGHNVELTVGGKPRPVPPGTTDLVVEPGGSA